MPQQSDSRTADKYVMRLPDGLRDRIKEIAKANRRSMNAEIVLVLERAFGAETAATGEILADSPVAALNTTARQGSDIINPAKQVP